MNKLLSTLLLGALALGACTSHKPEEKELTVLQFNIWQEGTVIAGGFDAIADEIARLKPDFVTLSEVRNYHDTRFCDRIVSALAERGEEYHSFYSYDSGLLSRYPITDSATVFPHEGDHGTIYRLNTKIDGKDFAVYTGHLDYQNDTYYEVRAYDGNSWNRMEEPLTDVDSIMARNLLSLRDEAIDSFLADAARQHEAGAIVIFGGDFNEPSHLDWTEATRDSADHPGVVIEWPNTLALHKAGYRDAYREVYPDPVTHPGYTYPSDNAALPPEKITWAPLSDERDRIDYIFFRPDTATDMQAVEAAVVGPKSSIAYCKRINECSADSFIQPLGVWPTDHKGVLVKLRYR